MRRAAIYYKETFAGILKEEDDGYSFEYEKEYLSDSSAMPISLTLPLSETKYSSAVLFPFFDGLIPEGWLLEIAIKNTDIFNGCRWQIRPFKGADC